MWDITKQVGALQSLKNKITQHGDFLPLHGGSANRGSYSGSIAVAQDNDLPSVRARLLDQEFLDHPFLPNDYR